MSVSIWKRYSIISRYSFDVQSDKKRFTLLFYIKCQFELNLWAHKAQIIYLPKSNQSAIISHLTKSIKLEFAQYFNQSGDSKLILKAKWRSTISIIKIMIKKSLFPELDNTEINKPHVRTILSCLIHLIQVVVGDTVHSTLTLASQLFPLVLAFT